MHWKTITLFQINLFAVCAFDSMNSNSKLKPNKQNGLILVELVGTKTPHTETQLILECMNK